MAFWHGQKSRRRSELETQKTNVDDRRKVSVDEDYLVFLHDQLASNQSKLKEILGSGAEVILLASADNLVNTLDPESTLYSVDGMVEKLKSWGMNVDMKRSGGSVEVELKCPYAETVHPRMASKEPMCPLNAYVLGAVRLEDKGALLQQNALLKDGARFVIRTSECEALAK